MPVTEDARRAILEVDVGMIWDGATNGSAAPAIPSLAINQGRDEPQDLEKPQGKYARPSSWHPGAVVVSYTDGHARLLSEQTSYEAFRHLMTPSSKEAGLRGVVQLP